MSRYLYVFLLLTISVHTLFGQSTRIPLSNEERIGDFKGIVFDLCFSKSGKTLFIPEGSQICLYDINTKKLKQRMGEGHRKAILSIDLSADTTMLASGGLDSLILIWNVQTGTRINNLHFHRGVVTSLSFNQDHTLLASGSSDKSVVIYDLKKGGIVYRFDDFSSDITSVKFSPDGSLLAVASHEKQIRLYNTQSGKLFATLEGHKKEVRDLCFNKSGNQLFSCGDDSRLILWDLRNLNHIRILSTETYGSDWLLSVDVNRDTEARVVAGLGSKISLISNYGVFQRKVGVSVNRILFQPGMGKFLNLAVATRGKGVYFMNAMQFGRKD